MYSSIQRPIPAIITSTMLFITVPVIFSVILLMLLVFLYFRRQQVSWHTIQMTTGTHIRRNFSQRSGLKKEHRDMLPVVVFNESFLVRETQCTVCLADYEPNDRLQKIPKCGHTFHKDCIDQWLAANSTCPLCRVSLIHPHRKASPHNTFVSSEARADATQFPPVNNPRELEPQPVIEVVVEADGGNTEGDN